MSMTDTIADMLTRIRNANGARHLDVEVPSSRLKVEIARILAEEGYIKGYEVIKDNKQGLLKIHLRYDPSKRGAISAIKRVSKPGLRVYVKVDRIPRVLNGLGTAILSTSKGILTDKEARDARVGGELLCIVY